MSGKINEKKLDDLFDQLENACSTLNELKNGKTNAEISVNTDFNEDELKLEEDETAAQKLTVKKHDTFEEIENKLKKLPKMQNSFDKLCYSDKSNNNEKPFLTLDDEIRDNKRKQQQGLQSKYLNGSSEFSNSYNKELKRNLLLLKNRHALDPKRHYRKLNIDLKGDLSGYKVGTVLDDMFENGKKGGVLNSKYTNGSQTSAYVTNIDKSNSILGNYLTDEPTGKYFKRKYYEIQESKSRYGKNKHLNKRKNK